MISCNMYALCVCVSLSGFLSPPLSIVLPCLQLLRYLCALSQGGTLPFRMISWGRLTTAMYHAMENHCDSTYVQQDKKKGCATRLANCCLLDSATLHSASLYFAIVATCARRTCAEHWAQVKRK